MWAEIMNLITIIILPWISLPSVSHATSKHHSSIFQCVSFSTKGLFETETEILFYWKLVEIVKYDSWIVLKSAVGPMNSSKISWIVK